MTQTSIAIELTNVGVRRTRRHYGRRSSMPGQTRPSGKEDFWVFRHVNLHVSCGEHVGILGLNGAGKTTLLRTMLGTLPPHEGNVARAGFAIGLLDIISVFDLRMTGFENIHLFGALHRLADSRLREIAEDVVPFSGLAGVMHVPVSEYSNGMFLRLAFSLALAAQPDLLFLDEVSVVGDLPFQRKASERVRKMRSAGLTVVSCSHAVAVLAQECDRLCVLAHGGLAFDGPPQDAVAFFMDTSMSESLGEQPPASGRGGAGWPSAVPPAPTDAMAIPPPETGGGQAAGGGLKRAWSPAPGFLAVEWEISSDTAEPTCFVAAVQKAGCGAVTFGDRGDRMFLLGAGRTRQQHVDLKKQGEGWYSVSVIACYEGAGQHIAKPLGTWSEWQYVKADPPP